MSGERSSSGVRNLRSLFENRNNDNTDTSRGRSPGGLRFDSEQRPRSKVRTSFFSVESPKPAMASAPDFSKVPNTDLDGLPALNREPSGRRTSFSEEKGSAAVQQLKTTVAEEVKRRESVPVAETIPETAVETPAIELDAQLGAPKRDVERKETGLRREFKPGQPEKLDKEAENPDKFVTGAEEEPADMKPAQPTSEDAVSGGAALPAVAEDLRKSADPKAGAKTSAAKTASKPAPMSTRTAPRQSTSTVRSPRTASTASAVTSIASTSSKSGRSSLTAPTASSVARTASGDKATGASAKPPPSAFVKPKPRDVTKPVDISSRLTAPTAASRAKHETAPAPSKPITTNRTKPSVTTNRSARPSLGRPESRSSQNAPAKKTTASIDSSFLERMSRPTAASSNRLKPDEKSQPKSKKLPTRPKPNGNATTAKTAKATAEEAIEGSTFIEEPSVVHEGENVAEPMAQAQEAAAENRAGSPVTEFARHGTTVETAGKETPNANGHQDTLEGTPAALGVEDSIR